MSHWFTRLGMFSLPFLAITRPRRAATRSHQPVIDLRPHHIPLRQSRVITRSVGVYLGLITSPHMVSDQMSSQGHIGVYLGLITKKVLTRSHRSVSRANNKRLHYVTSRHRSRHALFTPHKIFRAISRPHQPLPVSACSYYHNTYQL